jgi:hypothetical protein
MANVLHPVITMQTLMYRTTASVGQVKPLTPKSLEKPTWEEKWRTSKMQGFKIMDFKDGKLKTLFHGTHGTRVVPQWVRVRAQIREHAVDGGPGSAMYKSGFHLLETLDQAKAYLKKFKNMTNKVIVKVEVFGTTWKKDHSPAEGLFLAEWIMLMGIVWINVDMLFANHEREN